MILPSLPNRPQNDILPSLEKSSSYKYTLDDVEGFEECPSDENLYINDFVNTGWTGMFNLDKVISLGILEGASDVHLTCDFPVAFTILGDIQKRWDIFSPDEDIMSDLVVSILSHQQHGIYIKDLDFDCSYTVRIGPFKGTRLRANLGKSFGRDYLVFRIINSEIPSLEDLAMEQECVRWMNYTSGAFLVTGPTGSGKCLHKDTELPTREGFKKLENIHIHDIIYDENGEETKVVDKYCPYDRFLYEISFSSGDKVKAGGGHLWKVFCDKEDPLVSKSPLFRRDQKNILKMFGERERERVYPLSYFLGLIYGRDEASKEKMENFIKKEKSYLLHRVKDGDKPLVFTKEISQDLLEEHAERSRLKRGGEGVYKVFSTRELLSLEIFSKDGKPRFKIKALGEKAFSDLPHKDNFSFVSITAIEEIKDDPLHYFCLSVSSPSKTFAILKNGIITHNSTSLASLINHVNYTEQKKIVTVERPIEYIYKDDGSSLIVQRSVGDDCLSFAFATRSLLRMNPDALLIGECRDREEIEEFLRAAETGHLTMSTMHTNSCFQTVSRILALFDGSEEPRIRSTVSDVLKGIMNQTLVKIKGEQKRMAVREILTINNEIRTYIRRGDTLAIRKYMYDHGLLMEQKLIEVFQSGKITEKEARLHAPDPEIFDAALAGKTSEEALCYT